MILISISLSASAGDFRVITLKGSAKLKSKSTWKPLKIGDRLKETDQFKLEKESYINLRHSSGKTIDFNEDGTYKCSELAKELQTRKSEFSKRFADRVIDDIGSNESLLKKSNYKQSASITGAGERAVDLDEDSNKKLESTTGAKSSTVKNISSIAELLTETESMIQLRLPRNAFIIDSTATFSWYKKDKAGVYVFRIRNAQSDVVFEKSTPDAFITVDLDKAKINVVDNLFWSVTSEDGSKSEEYLFQRLGEATAASVRTELEEIIDEIPDMNSPMNRLILASFYADKNLTSRALDEYRKAVELAPSVKDYRLMLAKYLIRIGLFAEAEEIIAKEKKTAE